MSILSKLFSKKKPPDSPPWAVSQRCVSGHQIVYDDATRAERDTGFAPLENANSEQPDWYEYWPIRTYLHNTSLDESTWYGFVSPLFFEKTGLTAAEVERFIQVSEDADVYSFSPFPGHGASFLNVFEHMDFFYQGFMEHAGNFFARFDPALDVRALVNHSGNAIFSNFFFARPKFWREWLRVCDQLHEDTRDGTHVLNSKCSYMKADGVRKILPAKVFAMECVASYLLAGSNKFSSISYPLRLMPLSKVDANLRLEVSLLDGLKRQWLASGDTKILDHYRREQKRVIATEWPRQKLLNLQQPCCWKAAGSLAARLVKGNAAAGAPHAAGT